MNICKKCGQPEDLCICETIAIEQQKIRVYIARRKYGKPVTIIEGLETKNINLKELIAKIRQKLACGGTMKNNMIELQGDHKSKVKDVLVNLGFPEDQIEVA